jgi:hypothetical protein
MDSKGLHVEVKDAAKGLVKAVFSTFNVIDSDKDVTRPGAFDDGAEVPISSYGHTSWGGALPVGKGVIKTTDSEAILEGQFFMDTTHGKDAFLTVKELGGLGQWSYGYDPEEYSFGEFDGQKVRFLDKLKVHEVSPVLVGAGVGTRTLTAKSAGRIVRSGVIATHETAVTACSWDRAKTLAGLPEDVRPSELRSIHAWCDPDGDVESVKSYGFAHHHGVGGPANVRACLAHVAVLNGVKGAAVADRDGVYGHLAAHLREADVEVPELKSAPGEGSLKYLDEGHAVMAAVSAFVDRTAEVMALRKKKGKGMSPRSADLLGWIGDDLKRLHSLLDTPVGEDEPSEEQIASLFARSLAHIHGI